MHLGAFLIVLSHFPDKNSLDKSILIDNILIAGIDVNNILDFRPLIIATQPAHSGVKNERILPDGVHDKASGG